MFLSMLSIAKLDNLSSPIVVRRCVLISFKRLKLLSAVALLTGKVIQGRSYTKYVNWDTMKPYH